MTLLNNRLKGLNTGLKIESRHLKKNWKIQKLILKILNCIAIILLACVTQKLVKIVKLLRVKSYLVRTMDKLSKGKSNFETVLASQKCAFGKFGLGFNPQSKKIGISKPFSKVPEQHPIEKLKQPVVTCYYCMKRCHSVRFCKIRKYFVPKGIIRWIPKDSEVPSDKCKSKGPTFVRGPNLVA